MTTLNDVALARTDDYSVNTVGTDWTQKFGGGSISGGKQNDDLEWAAIGQLLEGALLIEMPRTGDMGTLNNRIMFFLTGSDDNFAIFIEEISANTLRFRARYRISGSSADYLTGSNIATSAQPTTEWMSVQRIGNCLIAQMWNSDPTLGGTRKGRPFLVDIEAAGIGNNYVDGRWGVGSRAASAKVTSARFYAPGDPAGGGGSVVVPTGGQLWPRGNRG